LRRPPRGFDLYVEDEAELSLFPTLTRMWTLRGKQRKIRAPGVHPPKRYEFAAVDWRTGKLVRIRALRKNSEAFCRLVEKCMKRSARRKRRVIFVIDRFRIHTPEGAKRVAYLLMRYGHKLRLRYLPTYSPELMPIEKLWNVWRDNVTHDHDRIRIRDLEQDSDYYFAHLKRRQAQVLQTISSPFRKPRR
jgi:transposase